jgi:hypothetical protein
MSGSIPGITGWASPFGMKEGLVRFQMIDPRENGNQLISAVQCVLNAQFGKKKLVIRLSKSFG